MTNIIQLLGNTDIYLLDQIMKGRYQPGERILDAGAGSGRNLHVFAQQDFDVWASDRNPEAIAQLRQNYPQVPGDHFQLAPLESMPFTDAFFDHVICSAVLHFAENPTHFEQMFAALIRVLKPGGTLFARVATDRGMADQMIPIGNGRYLMPDGSERFLLTQPAFDALLQAHDVHWLEPFKTVLVDKMRSMSVLMLKRGDAL